MPGRIIKRLRVQDCQEQKGAGWGTDKKVFNSKSKEQLDQLYIFLTFFF